MRVHFLNHNRYKTDLRFFKLQMNILTKRIIQKFALRCMSIKITQIMNIPKHIQIYDEYLPADGFILLLILRKAVVFILQLFK